MADTDAISALLNGRVGLDPAHAIFSTLKPARGADVTGDLYLAVAARAHRDGGRASCQIYVHRAVDFVGSMEGAFAGCNRRNGQTTSNQHYWNCYKICAAQMFS